jgi:hypothetical protein
MRHVHFPARNLFEGVRNGRDFDMAEALEQCSIARGGGILSRVRAQRGSQGRNRDEEKNKKRECAKRAANGDKPRNGFHGFLLLRHGGRTVTPVRRQAEGAVRSRISEVSHFALQIEQIAREGEERGQRNSGFVRQFRILKVGVWGMSWFEVCEPKRLTVLLNRLKKEKC